MNIPNVIVDPARNVEILEFNFARVVLAVRPNCHTDTYWRVYSDTNRVICESFRVAGFPAPEQHLVLRNGNGDRSGYSGEGTTCGAGVSGTVRSER